MRSLKTVWLLTLMARLLVATRAAADTEIADADPYEINALRAAVRATF